MVIQQPFNQSSYNSIVAVADGDAEAVFRSAALAVALRFYKQVGVEPPSEPFLNKLLNLVWESVHEHGLPKPLPNSDMGKPNEFDYEYIGMLVEESLSKLPTHRTADYLREILGQLYMTLLGSEFKTCRSSYMEPGPDGVCSRQNLNDCKDRISGSHCEDCPYFVALSEEQNLKLLKRVWKSTDPIDSPEVKSVMLPTDFRSLRVFWHLHIRYGKGS